MPKLVDTIQAQIITFVTGYYNTVRNMSSIIIVTSDSSEMERHNVGLAYGRK